MKYISHIEAANDILKGNKSDIFWYKKYNFNFYPFVVECSETCTITSMCNAQSMNRNGFLCANLELNWPESKSFNSVQWT